MTLHVVSGASRGLGAAMVRQLLQEGHHVVAAARGPAPAVPTSIGQLDWTSLDLGDLAAAEGWINQALASCPRPASAVLILNAGVIDPIGPAASADPVSVERHLRINLASPMLLAAAFLRMTETWSVDRRILAISSGAARHGIAHWSAYCSSKAGLDGFVRSLNAEYVPQVGVPEMRAVSLAPGVIDTGMQETIRSIDAPQRDRFVALHAEARLATPADAAASILAYLRQPDFGTTEIDDIRSVAARLPPHQTD